MKSAVETLNPTRVRLTVEVPFEELKPSLDAAYKKINQQVTVPGFRKGKIPARVIDQRFGRGAVLEEAINDALPKFYTEAVNEGELNVLGQPEVDITEFNDNEQLKFTAEVDIRPAIEIPDYSGIEVAVDAVEVSDEDVDKSVEQLRDRFASTTPVERAAADGDVVVVDLEAKVDGEVLEDGVAKGVTYTIGSGQLLDGIDEAVTGLEAGGSATFTSELKGGSAAGKEAEVKVDVTDVQARELPELDDDFAQLASEFDTLEELRADSRKRLEQMKKYDQATQAQEKVLDAAPGAGRGAGPGEAARGRDRDPHAQPGAPPVRSDGPDLGSTWSARARPARSTTPSSRSRRSRASRPSSSWTSWSTRRSCRSARRSSPSTSCAARSPPA